MTLSEHNSIHYMPFAVLNNELFVLILDIDFAYSAILEERLDTVADSLRNQSYAPFIRSEVLNVIVPLLEQPKYSPFHRTIKDTWNVFELGNLHNIREVEVFLLAGFRVSRFRPFSLLNGTDSRSTIATPNGITEVTAKR